MEPVEYLRIVRRRWPVLVAAVVLALAAAWLTTPSPAADPTPGPPERAYTATHTLIQKAGARLDSRQVSLELLAFLATNGEIPVRVAQRLGGDEQPALLAGQVQVTGDDKLGTITFTVTDKDADRAVVLANAFAEETLAYIVAQREETIRQDLEAATSQQQAQEAQIRELNARLVGMDPESPDAQLLSAERDGLLAQYQTTAQRAAELRGQEPQPVDLRTLQAATAVPIFEDIGFQPPSSRGGRLGIAVVVGLVLGVGLVFGLERVDIRVRTRRGAERAFGLPVVSEIPKLARRLRGQSKIVLVTQPASFAAETYRILRLSLQLMPRWILPTPTLSPGAGPAPNPEGNGAAAPPRRSDEGSPRVILVTSPGPGEGKTTTVANLAASFAEVGKVVLVLDCDVRRPALHRYLGVEQGPGVTDYLAGGIRRPSLERLARESRIPGVWVVPSGTPPDNPGELLGPDQDLITTAAEFADVVLLDAGPILSVNDPAALLPMVDAVVVVARSGHTTAEAAYRTSELLARLEAPLLGVALVGVPRAAMGHKYHDYQGRLAGPRRGLQRVRDEADSATGGSARQTSA